MRNQILIVLSLLGLVGGGFVAYQFSIAKPSLPPVFNPPQDPFVNGIFANGIIESDQPSGENLSVYPEVSGTVKQIPVHEGQFVHRGDPLLLIDDSIQRQTTEQQRAQSMAALSLLEELKAQPRKETLAVAESQVTYAQASLKTATDELAKQKAAYDLNPKAVSKDALDNAVNGAKVAAANLEVARRQYELTKAGAWSYDITNQERQQQALERAYLSSRALLAKYALTAPKDGLVLSINSTVGSFVSPQGAYDAYTQGAQPVLVLGEQQAHFNVRCYVDEILVPRLPDPTKIKAVMIVRGSTLKVPLTYVRTQPLVSPKIELADEKTERVDVRVLPVIFQFPQQGSLKLYPGQLVDVYIGE